MESVLNLKSYNKYKNEIDDGLIILPDSNLSELISDIKQAYRSKPVMQLNETHEVTLKAGKKVRITSRGSLRDIEIDGITYDSSEQAACSIYDPYNEYYDIYNEIRSNLLDFTFIPIIDTKRDTIRYTISKYSKGLKKYFDPHKVIKAVYSLDNILFYVKTEIDVLRKYYFKIGSINLNDVIPMFCKKVTEKYGMNQEFYLAFFIHEEDLPFTVGACKDDFYCLKDILNKISFKGTTPFKYMLFRELSDLPKLKIKEKEALAYNIALGLTNKTKKQLCDDLYIDTKTYDEMMNKNLSEVDSLKGTKIYRTHIVKYLHITEHITELKFYETLNLIWKVKYDDIPDL